MCSCSCISKLSHQRRTNLNLPQQPMVQVLLEFLQVQGLYPHHLKGHLLLLLSKEWHLVPLWETLLELHHLFLDPYCHLIW